MEEFGYLIKMADLLAHGAVWIVFVDHHPPCHVSALKVYSKIV